MALGDRILNLLEEQEISQKEFANSLNIAPTTLNGYIKNKRQPDFELVKNIASALNVSTDYLLGYDSEELNLTEKELTLLMKIRKLTADQQNMLYDLVNLSLEKSQSEK
jgi:transcriptional regulator with XRE-family HTH domain